MDPFNERCGVDPIPTTKVPIPDGMYTIDIKGDLTRDHRCFNLESRGKVKRLSEEHLKHLERGKANKGEEIPKDDDQ